MYDNELVYVSSVNKAYKTVEEHSNLAINGIFVGKRNFHVVFDPQFGDQEIMASHFRSFFLPGHGHRGLLYRVGEHILVKNATQVVKITSLFAIKIDGSYQNFVKGEMYLEKKNADTGEVEHYPYSDGVMLIPSARCVVVSTSEITRKVMLFPDPNNVDNPSFFVLIDYQRPKIPLKLKDVIVPFYPQKDDMVWVNGGEEIWMAHIQAVDSTKKTCQIFFYVKTHRNRTYARESCGHRALEVISWNSILCIAQGQWIGKKFSTDT